MATLLWGANRYDCALQLADNGVHCDHTRTSHFQLNAFGWASGNPKSRRNGAKIYSRVLSLSFACDDVLTLVNKLFNCAHCHQCRAGKLKFLFYLILCAEF